MRANIVFPRLPVASTLAALFLGQMALAEPLPAPTGPVLLTVTGAIGRTNADGLALFDAEMLGQIGLAELTTTTIWTDGPQVFEGVPLDLFLSALEAEGTMLVAAALNDYAVEIPMTDVVPGGPMLAIRMNGVDLSARDKGPVWLVYPYDSGPDYRREVIYARSVWQLDRIDVRP